MRKRKPTRSSALLSIAFLIIKIRALEKILRIPHGHSCFFIFMQGHSCCCLLLCKSKERT
ncbi:hypothetical protein Tsubulata_035248 [Turnera subulata]|uniref:Uncharacterized protein n=1 Tax=Turnera subulata TaxID=218843 RepID=A0A9Q0F4Y0_9ROSI|nr:hypothetical protein Tsubulata_035248 [Turnera subulata]